MTISMAFIAPALVKAAVEGRLPRGIGVASLRDAPAEWSRQFERLGLAKPLIDAARIELGSINRALADRTAVVPCVTLFASGGPGTGIFAAETGGPNGRPLHSETERPNEHPQKSPPNAGHFPRSPRSRLEQPECDGGRDRDRTCDPYHVKEVLFR